MSSSSFTKPAALADFPVVIRLPILWGDQDAFGHVNNTLPIRWFESARIAYMDQVGQAHSPETDGLGPILASITCNYRSQLNFPDTITAGARITRIGNSSFNMQHALYSEAQNVIACEGDSVIVMFNYREQKSVRVPDDIRAAINRLEGKSLG